MIPNLTERFTRHVRDADLFPDPGLALVAVSGGPDSVALLDLLCRSASALDLQLVVGHVDHGILPDSADVAELVLGLAWRYEVSGHMAALHLGPDASETRARRARYVALRELQGRLGARYLVTAHHADDQVETVLYRLCRGTGLAGLAGIAAVGPDGLTRPLLPFDKAELEDWVDGLPGRPAVHTDPSNADHRHHRSWIRGELIPVLRARFGEEIDEHLRDVSRHAASDRAAWHHALRALPGVDLTVTPAAAEIGLGAIRSYDNSLAEAILRAVAREAGCVLGPRRAARLCANLRHAPSGRRFDLGQGWVAETAFDRLRILILRETSGSQGGTIVLTPSAGRGRVRWEDWDIRWAPETAGEPRRVAGYTWVTPGPAEVRGPRNGDRLRPLGGTGRRRVRRLLMEGKVPRSDRRGYPVVVRGDEVLWVPGICRADVAVPRAGEPAIRIDVHAH